jgi:hypothetical protein
VTVRGVRVSAGFFDQLDAQLAGDPTPTGAPSAADFIALDLPAIINRFAEDFDELPEAVEGVPGARMLLAPGILVYAFVVYGVLADDGAIDVIGISIDTRQPPGEPA